MIRPMPVKIQTNTIKNNIPSLKIPKLNNILKFIWFSLCLIGCLYQSYDMIHLYFERQMNVETLYYPMDPVIPPSLVIVQFGLYKNLCEPEKWFCPRLWSTTKELFKNSPSFEDLFERYTFRMPNGTEENIEIKN